MLAAIYISIVVIMAAALFLSKASKKRKEQKLEEQGHYDDDSLFVEGVGYVKFDELGEEATKANPDDYILKKLKPSIHDIKDEDTASEQYQIKDLPLNEDRRAYLEKAFYYLEETFGKQLCRKKGVLQAEGSGFPLVVNSLEEIKPIAERIAQIMDIDPNLIELGFFEAGIREFNKDTGEYVYWDREDAGGLYHGKNEQGKFVVTLRDDILDDTENLIATIAHEFAHIKLLGEERLEENNEDLTDLLPLFYGFGIFMANSCFKFESNHSVRGFSNAGYLRQADWGYLFALYLKARNETDREWLNDLNKTVVKYCERASLFLDRTEERF